MSYYIEDHQNGTLRSGPDGGRIDKQPMLAATLQSGRGSERLDVDSATSLVPELSGVRRLTPIECERLQALPDEWTNPDGDASDARRYAALGDAVTATVGEWLGRRIMAA